MNNRSSGSRGSKGSRGGSQRGASGGSGRSNSHGRSRGANQRSNSASGSQRGPRRNESGGKRSSQRGTTPIRPPQSAAGAKRKTGGLGGDQVEGRQAVRELLMAGLRRPRELVMAQDLDPAPILDEITELADDGRVPIRRTSRAKFEAMARTDAPQGVLAFAEPIKSVPLADLARTHGSRQPFLLVLDGVTDPQNLGSILRVAECAGVTGIVLPRHRAARITASVTKTAAGAVEHLLMSQVAGIPAAIRDLKEAGVWTVGLDMVSDTTVFDMEVATQPVALVMGAEGKGISRLVRERCDMIARIPLAGQLDSLNVATATAVACYEVVRRRREV